MDNSVKRGDIFYADLSPVVGSEQGGIRPVLIVQNDTGNRHSPTVIAAAITSQTGKAKLPTHIELQAMSCGLPKESVILLEQIRTLDKRRLRERMGRLDEERMHQIISRSCGNLSTGILRGIYFSPYLPSMPWEHERYPEQTGYFISYGEKKIG